VSCENKYLLLNRIFSSSILNVNSKTKVFLFDNSKFQDNTNEDNSNDIDNFLSSDDKHDLNQNDVDKNNNLVKKFKSDDNEKNNDAKNVNMTKN